MADGFSNVVSIGQGRRGRRASAWEPWSEVKRLAQKPGRHRIGPNCELEVREPGKASLNFRYQFEGRERRMGLGPYQLAAPAELRDRVVDLQRKLRDGLDPLAEKAGAKQAPSRRGRAPSPSTPWPNGTSPRTSRLAESEASAAVAQHDRRVRAADDRRPAGRGHHHRPCPPDFGADLAGQARDGLQAPRAPRSDPRCFSAARSGQPGELARAAEGEPSRWAQGEAGRTSCGPTLAGDSEFHSRASRPGWRLGQGAGVRRLDRLSLRRGARRALERGLGRAVDDPGPRTKTGKEHRVPLSDPCRGRSAKHGALPAGRRPDLSGDEVTASR